MTIELSLLIAVIGGFVGLAGFLRSRDSKISSDSEWKGEVNAKLDMILEANVNQAADICRLESKVQESIEKVELKLHDLDHRLTITERDLKSAFRGIDTVKS